MVFDVPARGTAVKLQETLEPHSCSIADLAGKNNHMLSSDEQGNIILWKTGGSFTQVMKIDGYGYVDK